MAQRTLLWPVHQASGAQLAEFAGWEMPIRYSGIPEEHQAVRNAAGLFDVSHMGELRITGPEALAFADSLLTNKIAAPDKMRATYSPMCHADGGTVDDLFVYAITPDEVLLVVNAGNIRKDEAHIRSNLPETLRLADESDQWLQLALQGPSAVEILAGMPSFSGMDLPGMRFMTWKEMTLDGYPTILSRSGYTGGDGFELYVRCGEDAVWAASFWNRILDAGKPYGVLPAGLGARDTLRLEGALPLYGHELRDDVSPVEAGLSRFIRMDKGDFVGRSALALQMEKGCERIRAGLILLDRGIAREGCAVYPAEAAPNALESPSNLAGSIQNPESGGTGNPSAEKPIGILTSGGVGIHIGRNVAMALLAPQYAIPGGHVAIDVRGRRLEAEVVPMPFYRKPGA